MCTLYVFYSPLNDSIRGQRLIPLQLNGARRQGYRKRRGLMGWGGSQCVELAQWSLAAALAHVDNGKLENIYHWRNILFKQVIHEHWDQGAVLQFTKMVNWGRFIQHKYTFTMLPISPIPTHTHTHIHTLMVDAAMQSAILLTRSNYGSSSKTVTLQ